MLLYFQQKLKIICTQNKQATSLILCSKIFLGILTKIQPIGTLRSTSRLFIKELENELTFDAKTFSISVTRTMDGGGENDYDYVAIGELDSYEFFSDFSPLKWLLENSKLWVATYISSK